MDIAPDALTAWPRDLNDVPGHSGDTRTLDKLVDNVNQTMVDHHMWMTPVPQGEQERGWLAVDLGAEVEVSALRVWNYNKSADDTSRGLRNVLITLDGAAVSPPCGLLLRKAPGTDVFDFGQTIELSSTFGDDKIHEDGTPSSWVDAARDAAARTPHNALVQQGFDTPLLPVGHVLQLIIRSTWGDPFYAGLNGIELLAPGGTPIPVQPGQVHACPPCVGPDDVRTADKLVDQVNHTWEGRHMWLAPRSGQEPVRVYVLFDAPVMLAAVRIWNYTRTPARGVRDVAVLLDDLTVFVGTLRIGPEAVGPDFVQSILFTNEDSIVQSESGHVHVDTSAGDADLRLIDDTQWVSGVESAPKDTAPLQRPGTSLPANHGSPRPCAPLALNPTSRPAAPTYSACY